jgi:(1->4)-alpha-D-glucan 1-alpha-D-glucosylmutase
VWEQQLRSWSRINRLKKSMIKGDEAPDRNDEYLLYQTLIGSYPVDGAQEGDFLERLKSYLIKAVREAKVHTEWLKPDLAYERAFIDFADAILDPSDDRFRAEFMPFLNRIAYGGMFNSLAQTLLKMTVPGVPDIYQGSELWDLSFVDPDNRRAVDFTARARCLKELKAAELRDPLGLLRDLLSHWQDGRIKLYLMAKLLQFRRAYADLFASGEFLPLQATGEMGKRVCAFARRRGRVWVLAIASRLVGQAAYHGYAPLGEDRWGVTAVTLPAEAPRDWRDVVSGETLKVAPPPVSNRLLLGNVFKHFPVALLYDEKTMGPFQSVEENEHATIIEHPA